MQFTEMGLSEPLQRALREAGYTSPTPIQQAAIGPALEGKDVLGCAQTGTGKTAAFTLPVLQHIHHGAGDEPELRGLVLTPTRELAAQIGQSVDTYGKFLDLYHTVVVGGVSEKAQIRELKRGVDLLVATPGRLLDLLDRGFVSLDAVDLFVLDEADRMLDMGFVHDVKKISARLPKKRQTLFFSATMPTEIRKLAHSLLHEPVQVSVTPPATTAEKVSQRLYFVEKGDKPDLLVELLKAPGAERTIVFCRTKHGANRIAKALEKAEIRAAAIHGNKSQGARTRALDGFKSGDLQVLVATDIAARGIDVTGISLVVNYDIPNVPETYVHRIGRTARAGREGAAVSFCQQDERYFVESIEKLTQQHIERVSDHPYRSSVPAPPATELRGRHYHNPKPKLEQGGARGGGSGGGGRGGARPGARRGANGARPAKARRPARKG